MALSAIIMAGLIVIGFLLRNLLRRYRKYLFLLRYLLRRYRKYFLEKIRSQQRHGQTERPTEQEHDQVTVKKELVSPPSCRRIIYRRQNLSTGNGKKFQKELGRKLAGPLSI